MTYENINVRIKGQLQAHLLQQIGKDGLYENASEYIRSLIRKDIKENTESWEWLKKHLEPALRATENTYIEASVQDVINRNKDKNT